MAPRKKQSEPKPGHVIKLQGKEYITHIGLLDLAHKAGMQFMGGDYLYELCDPDKDRYVYRATVRSSDGLEFSAVGHASPKNLNRKMVPFAAVMAETRAWNRAMRSMVNHGETTADEMQDVGLNSQPIYATEKSERVLRTNPDKWWQCIQTKMLECPGLPTPDEVNEICQFWSKGRLSAEDCSTVRLENLIDKIASPEGQALLDDIRTQKPIQQEGASK